MANGTDWHELDAQLRQDNWHLQVNRHYDDWRALYLNATAIPRSGRGKTLEEAVSNAAKLVLQHDGS